MANTQLNTKLLSFDYSGSLLKDTGIAQAQIDELSQTLETIRDEMYSVDLVQFHEQTEVTPERQPLDAGFMDLPDRMLSAYDASRDDCELG